MNTTCDACEKPTEFISPEDNLCCSCYALLQLKICPYNGVFLITPQIAEG